MNWLTGNEEELLELNDYYDKDGNQLIVYYGQRHTGMEEILTSFCQEKPAVFYRVRSCSEREQRYLWGAELRDQGAEISEFPTYKEIFEAMVDRPTHKKVIVISEFHELIKESDTFIASLIEFIHNQWNIQPVMVILASGSVGWVENSMLSKMGKHALEISGLVKCHERDFFEFAGAFSRLHGKRLVETYSVFGGFPGLWKHLDDGVDIRKNVCKYVLSDTAMLQREAERIVDENLRETNVYHTILLSLANGNNKLNDLFKHTEFSRAKISVYLKNLIEQEIVEKVESFASGWENTQKGIYRIKHPFVNFYFRFIVRHESQLQMMGPEAFYDAYIAPGLNDFISKAFPNICRQWIDRESYEGRLPLSINEEGEWIGKVGNIDCIARNEYGDTLIASCNWNQKGFPLEDFELMVFCAKKAKVRPNYVYLFSSTGFAEELEMVAEGQENLHLITLDELEQ